MQQTTAFGFAHPGSLQRITGGNVYDKRLLQELTAFGWLSLRSELPDTFPFPSAAQASESLASLASLADDLPPGAPVMIDGLALGALPAAAGAVAPHPLVALVHHPLALETGLTPAQAAGLRRSERLALANASGVVVTSASTSRILVDDYQVPPCKITVAPPGVDPRPAAPGTWRRGEGPPCLLCVGGVSPRKDQAGLVETLAGCADLPWQALIVGSLERYPDYARTVQDLVERLDLSGRVRLTGELDGSRLAAAFAEADLFVSASRYEGYGMALAEAVAAGLPSVVVDGGATRHTLPKGAGLLVQPEDLAAGLRRALGDHDTRELWRTGALAARERLPAWGDTARTVANVLQAVAQQNVQRGVPRG